MLLLVTIVVLAPAIAVGSWLGGSIATKFRNPLASLVGLIGAFGVCYMALTAAGTLQTLPMLSSPLATLIPLPLLFLSAGLYRTRAIPQAHLATTLSLIAGISILLLDLSLVLLVSNSP